jgi:hypothetical protein
MTVGACILYFIRPEGSIIGKNLNISFSKPKNTNLKKGLTQIFSIELFSSFWCKKSLYYANLKVSLLLVVRPNRWHPISKL